MAKVKRRVDNKNGDGERRVTSGPVFELKDAGDLWHSGPCYRTPTPVSLGHWHSRSEVATARAVVDGLIAFDEAAEGMTEDERWDALEREADKAIAGGDVIGPFEDADAAIAALHRAADRV